ncbi:actin depolymerizing protein [Daedalea quercina L-15889]|uniref:Actin depolymerizing protein n=1 Tax=Daedalea quercina L-15889 TaxID=1314783 RepID=A0A165PFS9_9APHY|nr:actin depolymerizing protein [Daedalea quercina L-15889]
MSAPTGIAVSEELSSVFASAIESQNVRFLKISIRNESLVPDETIPPSGTLEQDLDRLNAIVEDDIPAYVLVRFDAPPSEWLAIYYVPDSAKVRDKMLYAATRTTLAKTLGAAHFTDSIFATSKDDLSADAYVKHKQHLAAPKPMSAREKEIEAVKAAERQAGGYGYEGSNARRSHVASGVGFKWAQDTDDAVKGLASGSVSLLVLSIDPSTETIILSSATECSIDQLGSSLPASEPSYGLFALPQSLSSSQRELVFIYSCPSSSPVKNRMLYSSGKMSTYLDAKKALDLEGGPTTIAERKIETSDPSELNESYLASELGRGRAVAASVAAPAVQDEKKPFARPKGPGRKR